MNRKGFTLIELLAVIIILSIVSIVAVPIVLDVIEESKISAGLSESNIILNGINTFCEAEKLKTQNDPNYKNKCTKELNKEIAENLINKGNASINDIVYNGDKILNLEIRSNNHIFTLCSNGKFVENKEECKGIYDIVSNTFPQLKTNGKGCINPSNNNYSYMNGCYLKGKQKNNYLWFSGFLWRIMGINADGTIRMITDENISALAITNKENQNNWDKSFVKKWLNNYFYEAFRAKGEISKSYWCTEKNNDKNLIKNDCSDNYKILDNIGILSLDEYMLSGEGGSYLNTGQIFWTMTASENSNYWYVIYNPYNNFSGSNIYGIRPIININPLLEIQEGNGIINEEVYKIREEKLLFNKHNIADIVTPGEYINFSNKIYRIVGKDKNGNVKIILDKYHDNMYSYDKSNNLPNSLGINSILNKEIYESLFENSELKNENENKIYKNYIWNNLFYNQNSDYEQTFANGIESTVGLINVGEILSSQSESILTDNYKEKINSNFSKIFWTYSFDEHNMIWGINQNGIAIRNSKNKSQSIRPCVVIKKDVLIQSGTGTWSDPYKI